MNTCKTRLSILLCAAAMASVGPGCDTADTSSADPSYGCAGKCDDADPGSESIQPFAELDVFDVRSDIDNDTQSLSILLELEDSFYDLAQDGDTVDLSLSVADSSASDDFAVLCEATYDESTVGAFVCPNLDTSDLLPWSVLAIRVSGELGGMPVRQEFELESPSLAPLEPLATLNFYLLESNEETMRGIFDGELAEGVRVPDAEYELTIEVSGVDATAAEGFHLRSEMTGDDERVVAEALDLAELFPVQTIEARVTGVYDGQPVEQTFEFDIDTLTEWW